ncbi:hypothetical protein QR680_015303 [Steinernema hermaphroditum]|uniref:Uncharacterized protein n=1 Tax=Steinernema hermaphroditum TaxID=289476 RepID=A0AA39H787_9BILA|nr:hypothetical protein QR680_015303 [Steinernema hermaphroditum]
MHADDVNKFLSYFLTAISYSFAIPFFYIVIFKSPPSIRVYKSTILNLALWDIIAMGSYTIFLQPVYTLLPNKSCARFVGLVSYFGIETNVAVMYLTVISGQNAIVAIIICFFYRYDQMSCLNKRSFMESWKGILLCVVLHVTISMFSAGLAYVFLLGGEMTENNGTFLLCYHDDIYHIVKTVALVALISLVAQSIMFVGLPSITIRRLRSQKAMMNKRTYRLQQLLTINLVILLIFPIVFDVIPFCSFCYAVYTKSESLYFWVSLIGHTPAGDVILTFATTLCFVTPYREAVKKILWKRNTVTPVTVACCSAVSAKSSS